MRLCPGLSRLKDFPHVLPGHDCRGYSVFKHCQAFHPLECNSLQVWKVRSAFEYSYFRVLSFRSSGHGLPSLDQQGTW